MVTLENINRKRHSSLDFFITTATIDNSMTWKLRATFFLTDTVLQNLRGFKTKSSPLLFSPEELV